MATSSAPNAGSLEAPAQELPRLGLAEGIDLLPVPILMEPWQIATFDVAEVVGSQGEQEPDAIQRLPIQLGEQPSQVVRPFRVAVASDEVLLELIEHHEQSPALGLEIPVHRAEEGQGLIRQVLRRQLVDHVRPSERRRQPRDGVAEAADRQRDVGRFARLQLRAHVRLQQRRLPRPRVAGQVQDPRLGLAEPPQDLDVR